MSAAAPGGVRAADGSERDISDLPGPRGLPILGNALQVVSSQLHLSLEKWSRRTGDYFRIRLGGRELLVIKTPEAIATESAERFLAGEVEAVFLAYNEFKSAISQKPVVVQLFPIMTAPEAVTATTGIDFKYEPSRDALLADLLPRHVATQVWRALLESAASEHGARMSAMESATKNAEEMIAALTLQYNRARQAYVTKELMEIVSGAEALK